MVIYEHIEGTDLVRAFSTLNKKLIQDGTGEIYDEAVDPDYMNRTYTESEEEVELLEPEEILEILLGNINK